jgi:hypothetical protein
MLLVVAGPGHVAPREELDVFAFEQAAGAAGEKALLLVVRVEARASRPDLPVATLVAAIDTSGRGASRVRGLLRLLVVGAVEPVARPAIARWRPGLTREVVVISVVRHRCLLVHGRRRPRCQGMLVGV